jgi:hypothetical protein
MKAEQIRLHQTVYHNEIYQAREAFKVVGIRETEVELEGDYSGAYNIIQRGWMPIKGLRKTRNNKPWKYSFNKC